MLLIVSGQNVQILTHQLSILFPAEFFIPKIIFHIQNVDIFALSKRLVIHFKCSTVLFIQVPINVSEMCKQEQKCVEGTFIMDRHCMVEGSSVSQWSS